jgi:hypothetical protein
MVDERTQTRLVRWGLRLLAVLILVGEVYFFITAHIQYFKAMQDCAPQFATHQDCSEAMLAFASAFTSFVSYPQLKHVGLRLPIKSGPQ